MKWMILIKILSQSPLLSYFYNGHIEEFLLLFSSRNQQISPVREQGERSRECVYHAAFGGVFWRITANCFVAVLSPVWGVGRLRLSYKAMLSLD